MKFRYVTMEVRVDYPDGANWQDHLPMPGVGKIVKSVTVEYDVKTPEPKPIFGVSNQKMKLVLDPYNIDEPLSYIPDDEYIDLGGEG